MAYQSINARKDEFRKYLEKNGVVDAITKVLVALYEEPERPSNPLEYIRNYLGGQGASSDAMKQENDKLREKVKELQAKLGIKDEDAPHDTAQDAKPADK